MRQENQPVRPISLFTYLKHKLFLSCMMPVMLLVCLLATADVAMAQLDPNFGTGGKVLTDFNLGQSEFGSKVLIQPDGKLIVVGSTSFFQSSQTPSNPNPALARYNSDGSLDTSFGNGGRVVAPLPFRSSLGDGVLQPDGKIIAVGTYNSVGLNGTRDYLVMRFNANGSLDTTFDSDGYATLSFSSNTDLLEVSLCKAMAGLWSAGFRHRASQSALRWSCVTTRMAAGI